MTVLVYGDREDNVLECIKSFSTSSNARLLKAYEVLSNGKQQYFGLKKNGKAFISRYCFSNDLMYAIVSSASNFCEACDRNELACRQLAGYCESIYAG